jgi:metallo-beta-lactamase family protein
MKSEERRVSMFSTERMTVIATPQESKELVASNSPAIVIAPSGMATGGRVLHHLAAGLPNPTNTVLFVGYQAEGTRGRLLVDGAKQVKIQGEFVPVAARVEKIDSMSAHADAGEIMQWLSGFKRPPSMTYLVHGEPVALNALKAAIESTLGWSAHVAGYLERVTLPSA